MDLSRKKIVVTGGTGFLGKYVVNELLKKGAIASNILVTRSKKIDLRVKKNCLKATKGADIVIHLAGNVGGIGKNNHQPANLFYDNLLMGLHIIDASMKNRVKKLVLIGTVCSYPKFTPTPFQEKNLWSGYPEETNAPYGLAKKMLLVGANAYRQQYGLKSIYLIPVNLFGPGDKYDPDNSHVIPSLIYKFLDAKIHNHSTVTLWGDGSPTREFLYVEDAARAIVLATIYYEKPDPVNLGSGMEISIRKLAHTISKLIRYNGKILWDKTKPNGQPRRLLDTTKAWQEFKFRATANFSECLSQTIRWYERKIPRS